MHAGTSHLFGIKDSKCKINAKLKKNAKKILPRTTHLCEKSIKASYKIIFYKLKSLATGEIIKKNQLSDKIQGFDKSRNVT